MSESKPSWYLIDSNVFLRAFVNDDPATWQDCTKFLRSIERGIIKAYVPSLVIAEVQYVLYSFYGFSREPIVEAIKSITTLPNLYVHEDISIFHAVDLYEGKNIKFIDCCIASSERVQKGEAMIVSYDRDFDKLNIPRLEPGKLVKFFKL